VEMAEDAHFETPVYHVGFIVPNIQQTVEGFARSIGARWDTEIFYDPLPKVRVSFLRSVVSDEFANRARGTRRRGFTGPQLFLRRVGRAPFMLRSSGSRCSFKQDAKRTYHDGQTTTSCRGL